MGSMATAEVDVSALLERREGYRNGWPCLRGTGITVHAVAAAHLSGLAFDEICDQNPDPACTSLIGPMAPSA